MTKLTLHGRGLLKARAHAHSTCLGRALGDQADGFRRRAQVARDAAIACAQRKVSYKRAGRLRVSGQQALLVARAVGALGLGPVDIEKC